MDIKHVEGKDKGDVFLYALSTCGWCKKTKAFLSEQGVAYSYVDVDLESGPERDRALQEVAKWNPSRSFPTLVVNSATCIVGYQPDRIKEELKL